MTAILPLPPENLVASGVQRDVYLHPTEPTKLIKVLKPSRTMPRRNTFNGIMDRLLPSTRKRQIRKEYEEYLRIMLAENDAELHLPVAHMFGFVATDAGLGCLTERVMAPDTSLGETLAHKIKSDTLTDDHVHRLNNTVARIFGHNIRASDMNAKNFVFGQRDYGMGLGPKECVLVDGFGDVHAIPVRSMAKWSNRLGLIDSCKRLARNTGLNWHEKSREFSR